MRNHETACVGYYGLAAIVARARSVAVVVAISPALALAQGASDARSVVETVLERRAERLAGVENYTLVQTMSGAEATLYFERVEVDGIPVFRIVPPQEYEGEALEQAGLGGGAGLAAVGGGGVAGVSGAPGGPPPGGIPGGVGAGLAEDALPPLLEGLSLPGGLGLPGGLSPPDGLPLAGGGPFPLPGGAPGGVPGPSGVGGAALGAATGGLQQQLAQKGMEGLIKLATPGSEGAVEEALLSVRGLQDLAETGRLDGTEVVDGAECYVLRTDRIQDLELARQMGAGANFTLRSLTIWIDTKEYVPRRTRATGDVVGQGRPREMTIDILEQDYRRVEGMFEPFRREIRMPDMGAILAAEDPEKADEITKAMQENLAKVKQMEEMLAQMPPEQRRMVEAQMGPAVAQMQQVAENGPGAMQMVTEVKELRVNSGPPTPFGTGEVTVEGEAALELRSVVARATPVTDATGRAAGWVINLIGAVEGQAGGVVQIAVAELSSSGEGSGNGGASFRWDDGTELQLVASEGDARLTITSSDATRVSGEFSFEATGHLRRADEVSETRAVVRGRFQAPVPPAVPEWAGGGGPREPDRPRP